MVNKTALIFGMGLIGIMIAASLSYNKVPAQPIPQFCEDGRAYCIDERNSFGDVSYMNLTNVMGNGVNDNETYYLIGFGG